MNVYQAHGDASFSGGIIAIVAADSAEQALEVLKALPQQDIGFLASYPVGAVVRLDGVSAEGEPRVITHFEYGD